MAQNYMRTGMKPVCCTEPRHCCRRGNSAKQRWQRENFLDDIPILCQPCTSWQRQRKNKTSKRPSGGASRSRDSSQETWTVSSISPLLRCALESSILREQRSARSHQLIGTEQLFTSLQAGSRVRKEILPSKRNNSRPRSRKSPIMIFTSSTSQRCRFSPPTWKKTRKRAIPFSALARWLLTELARCGRCLTML